MDRITYNLSTTIQNWLSQWPSKWLINPIHGHQTIRKLMIKIDYPWNVGGLKLSDAFPLKFHMVLDWSILPSLCRTCFGLAMAWAARSHGTSSWASTFVSIWDVIRIIDPQPQPNSTIDPQLIHIESIEMCFFSIHNWSTATPQPQPPQPPQPMTHGTPSHPSWVVSSTWTRMLRAGTGHKRLGQVHHGVNRL